MLLCKGSPNLTEKEGYDIYLFTTHRGKTSRGKELYRKEIYLKKEIIFIQNLAKK